MKTRRCADQTTDTIFRQCHKFSTSCGSPTASPVHLMCWMSNSCLWSVSSWLCQFGSRFVGTTLPPPRPSFHQLRRILCWTLWVRVMALTFNSVLQTEYVSLTELHVSTTCEVHASCNYRLWQYTVHWSTFDIIVVIFLFECVLAWKNWHIFRNVLSSTAFESNLWFTKKLDPITLVPSHQILTRAVTRSRALL